MPELQLPYWTPHRRSVLSRILAAVLGGYVFTTITATFLARLLGLTAADTVTSALLASFLIYAAAIMWVFAAQSAARAWVGLLVTSAICGAVVSFMDTGLPS